MGVQMCVVHQHVLQVSSIPGLTVGESPSIILCYYFCSSESVIEMHWKESNMQACPVLLKVEKKCLETVNIHVKCV